VLVGSLRSTGGMTSCSRTSPHAFQGRSTISLINPYGMMFEEITASSLVKIDLAWQQDRWTRPIRNQPGGFHDPQLHPRGASRRPLRHARAFAQRRRGRGAEGGICCRFPSSRCSCCLPWRTTTTRASRFNASRAAALGCRSRRQGISDAAQSRTVDGRIIARRSVFCTCTCSSRPARSKCAPKAAAKELICVYPEPILDGIRAAANHVTRGLGSALVWPGPAAQARSSQSRISGLAVARSAASW
jgi:hypothetical protein